MSRPRSSIDDDEDSEDDEEPSPPRRRRSMRTTGHRPVQRWNSGDRRADDEDSDPASNVEQEPARRGLFHRAKRPVFWRARDSVYFEPLVALAIVVLLLVSLWAYAQNWPPVYVVESRSMQHGASDQLGLINAGDLILAKKTTVSGVIPYFDGLRTAYSTYGESGDVVLYSPNGISGGTPIIHRAILYLIHISGGKFSVPELFGLPCGRDPNALYVVNTANGCLQNASAEATGSLTLLHVGWQSVNVSVDLGSLGAQSGFLTMGDNNFANGIGIPDQPTLSSLVRGNWIVGVARGMIPWFGAFKLLLGGGAANVSTQSWELLGITIVGLLLLGFGIHYALRAEGIEDERRRREEQEQAEEQSEEGGRPTPWRRLRPWRTSDDDEEGEEDLDERPRPHWFSRREKVRPHSRRGRPHPRTRREEAKEAARRHGGGHSRRHDDDPERG